MVHDFYGLPQCPFQFVTQQAGQGENPGNQPAMPDHAGLIIAIAHCESRIAELQQAVADLTGNGGHMPRAAGQDGATLDERLGSLENRLIEQDLTIRRTLSTLIDWIERDEARSVAA